jgi:hypothetical protein
MLHTHTHTHTHTNAHTPTDRHTHTPPSVKKMDMVARAKVRRLDGTLSYRARVRACTRTHTHTHIGTHKIKKHPHTRRHAQGDAHTDTWR